VIADSGKRQLEDHAKALNSLPLVMKNYKSRPVTFADYSEVAPTFVLSPPKDIYESELDMTTAFLLLIKSTKCMERTLTSQKLPVLPSIYDFLKEPYIMDSLARSGGMLEVIFFRLQERMIMAYRDNKAFEKILIKIYQDRNLVEQFHREPLKKSTKSKRKPTKDLHLSLESTNLSINSTSTSSKKDSLQISSGENISIIAPFSQKSPPHKNQKYPKNYYKNNNYFNGGHKLKRPHPKPINNKLHQKLYNQYKMFKDNNEIKMDNETERDKKFKAMRKEYAEFKIWLRTEKLCLKCGYFHMGNPCPSKFCPVCKQKDNHSSFIYCPYLKCQICSELHPLKTCPKLINYPEFFAKCLSCGYLGHFASSCSKVHQTKMKLKFLQARYINLADKDHDPNHKEHLDKITEKYEELIAIRHKNCTDYFSIWLRILTKRRKRSKRKKKRTYPGKNPKKKRYKRF